MNEKETIAYLESLRTATLRDASKTRMRASLGEYADFHMVREGADVRSITTNQYHTAFTLFIHSSQRIMKATLLVALVIGLGGSSFAAQQSLPGDVLHPLKVAVNENIRGAFALDANAKAQWELAVLNERLEEATTLSSQGKLEGELKSSVQADIAGQVDAAIAASEEADAEVRSETRVAVYEALSSFGTRLAIVPPHLSNSLAMETTQAGISAKDDVAMTMRMGGDMAQDVSVSAFGTSELAGDISIGVILEQAVSRHAALVETVRTAVGMDVNVKAELEARLADAGKLIAEAQMQVKTQGELAANAAVQKAHEMLGEIESQLSLMGEVTIDPSNGHIIHINLSSDGNTSSSGSGFDGGVGEQIDIQIESEGSFEGAEPAILIDPMPAELYLGN